MNYTLKQKAYKVDFGKIDEGYLASDIVCHAETIGKAKVKLLREIGSDYWKLKYTDEEITFKNIPVVRASECDLFEFEGKDLSMARINEIAKERDRKADLDAMLDNPKIEFCYIKKRGMYYRPNSCGYTDFTIKAGVYDKKDAVSEAKFCDEIYLIPIDIEEHNDRIQDAINDLHTRLILKV